MEPSTQQRVAGGLPDDASDFLCVRCARRRKTCCQISEIFVTEGDVRRVAEFTGREQFAELRRPDNLDYADQDDDPIWRDQAFRADGTRPVLKRQENGDCTFLGPQGCVMPLSVRPLICRLYPFEYTAAGLSQELADGCPTELLRTGQSLLNALEMDAVAAEGWRQQLYAEITADYAARQAARHTAS